MVRPWNEPSAATTSVAPRACPWRRASLSAVSLASAPEFTKKARSKARAPHERIRQLELRERVVQVRDLDQASRLARDRIGHDGAGVAQDGDRDAGDHVQVAVSRVVGHPAAVAGDQGQRLARVDLEVDARLELGGVDPTGHVRETQDHGRVPQVPRPIRRSIDVEHLGHVLHGFLDPAEAREVARAGGDDVQLADAGLPRMGHDGADQQLAEAVAVHVRGAPRASGSRRSRRRSRGARRPPPRPCRARPRGSEPILSAISSCERGSRIPCCA